MITDRLPAVCSVTITVSPAGAVVRRLRNAETLPGVLITGMTEPLARQCARALARFNDPERSDQGAGLPDLVTLLPLLGLARSADGAVPGSSVAARLRDGRA